MLNFIDKLIDDVINGGNPIQVIESNYEVYADTLDGKIKGEIRYNPGVEKFQVYIGGLPYGEHSYIRDAKKELSGAGFKIK